MTAQHADLVAQFEHLVSLPAAARESVLQALPPDLRLRLERLLAADAAADDPLAGAVAAQALSLSAPTASGTRLGPYRVVRELGAGGMGSVLLAERADGQFAQQVAIKLIRGFPTEEGKRRLRQERQILAQLDHPNIAHLVDGGESADGQPYVVMEYVQGLGLLEHIARHQLGLRPRLELFDRVAAAVQHAHERLVIHRDLKPGNVLVRDDGEPKLLDFGVAKLVDLSAASDPRQTSTRVWTPGYASPEQQSGGLVTTASDVYALAILLREMLSGERAAGQGAAPPAGFLSLPLDADLRGILTKASADSPAERYSTVQALRDDLQRWRDGRPVRAAPDTIAYRSRKFVARHRWAAALVVLAVLGVAAFVWRLDGERERALAAEARATAALHAAERDAATARSALHFLTDAFAAAIPEQAMSTQVSVRDLLDHARRRLEERAVSDATLRQPMQRLLGHLYSSFGEPNIAVDLFAAGLAGLQVRDREEALAVAIDYDSYAGALGALERGRDSLAAARVGAGLRRRFAPGDPEQELRALDQLGFGYYRSQDYARAETMLTRALAAAAKLPNPPPDVVTNTYQVFANMLAFKGEYARALALADEGLAFAQRLPDQSPLRVNLLRARSEALGGVGRTDEAEAAIRQAIALQERAVGQRGLRLGALYNGLGTVLNDLGRYRESLAALERARELDSDAGGSPMEEAIGLNNLASVRENAGDYAGALTLFEQALARAEQGEAAPDALERRKLEVNYARCLALAGQHAGAQERLAHLRQRALQLDGEDSFEYAMVTWQATLLARRMGDATTGLPLLDEAQRRLAALLPASHSVFAHVLRVRAAFAQRRGDVAQAERDQREAVARLEAAKVLPVDLAIARAELGGILYTRGDRAGARHQLDQALPILRDSVLPQEVNRAAAEILAARL